MSHTYPQPVIQTRVDLPHYEREEPIEAQRNTHPNFSVGVRQNFRNDKPGDGTRAKGEAG
ncbi:hypothetical protein SARC_12686, partial [Sphaeroforma arctica JP610]